MNQQDLRVIKTKKNIEQSFLRLLEKRSFSEITVQNILDEALINRSTFYKHYSDKYDLARLLSDRMFSSALCPQYPSGNAGVPAVGGGGAADKTGFITTIT